PGAADRSCHGDSTDDRRPERAQTVSQHNHDEAEQDDGRVFDQIGPVGSLQILTVDHLFEDLGVNLDPRHGRVQWRRFEIQQALRRSADEHDIASELRDVEAGIEDLPDGYEPRRLAAGIVEDYVAMGVDRHDELPDLDVVQTGLDSRSILSARVGGF